MDIVSLFNELIVIEAIFIKLLLGTVFGLCLGLTGVGGGVMLIPMLQVFCDMNTVLSVGTASIISTLVKINASVAYIKVKNVSWNAIFYLFIGSAPVALLSTQVVIYFNRSPVYQQITQQILSGIIIIVMLGALVSVLWKFKQHDSDVKSEKSYLANRKVAIFSGMFCGSVLGSTGVGGGVLLLPVFNSVLNIDIKKAIGSSVVLALCLSMITALSYSKGGQADWNTAILFIIGSLPGVPVAAKLMHLISEKTVYFLTIIVITISLLLTIIF